MAEKRKETKSKHISGQLLLVLIPMVTAALIIITVFIAFQAKGVIESEATSGLFAESKAYAAEIAGSIEGINAYLNSLTDTIERSSYTSDEEMLGTLVKSLDVYKDVVIDTYIAFGKETFLDGGGWVPDSDYDATTRGWYQTGQASSVMALGNPSVDMTTGSMVVCSSRQIAVKDGRSGVLSADIALSGISEEVSGYKPATTGASMLLGGGTIIAHQKKEYVGTTPAEHTDDALLKSIAATVDAGGSTQVKTITGNDGDYYVSFNPVSGTNWTMISYVKKNDILAPLYRFLIISVILAVIMVIAVGVVLYMIIHRMVTKPVTKLTANISRIAQGDFSVDVEKDKSKNEIGIMNAEMFDYVQTMRGSMQTMKDATAQLTHEVDNSKTASNELTTRASEQSLAMQQILEAMDGMSQAITDLANNSTTLAQEVAVLSEKGTATKDTMGELVTKAKSGKEDMSNVQSGMKAIAQSMEDMNHVVESVDESAKKIESIIDIIDSISSQTNLLSLNASIEAARAGEAGKGFAVVASEIGSLAMNSAESTRQIADIVKEITAQIRDLSAKSEENKANIIKSVEAVDTAGETFEEIFRSLDEAGDVIDEMIDKVSTVNDIATSVAAISEEQSASTEEVTATTNNLATSAEAVAGRSRDVDESASSVSNSADRIADFIETFKI